MKNLGEMLLRTEPFSEIVLGNTALARAITTLLADPDRRRAMGAAGSAYVRTTYSREVMAAGMVALYTELLSQR